MTHFSFAVPGQPMSWNRSYRQRVVTVKDRFGRALTDDRGRVRTRSGVFKTKEAELFQDQVRMIARLAKPTGFKPAAVIVTYDFILARDIDCDNVMKMVNDALSRALDLDDRYFYPVVLSKTTGSKNPETLVSVYDRSAWRVSIEHQPA